MDFLKLDKKRKWIVDENFRKEINQLSITQIAREAQKRIAPLSYVTETSDSMRRIADYKQTTSATSIANIAMKAFQQSGLDFTSFENPSTIAMAAGLVVQNPITPQNTFLEMTKGMSAYNNFMSVKERMIQSMGGTNFYEDIMGSVNLARKSIEPLRDSFNAAHNVIKTNEISTLVSYFQSQNALTNSVLSDYASIFKQVESLHSLESFKAISRLKNFPLEGLIPNESDSLFEIDNVIDETVLELDAEISGELSLIEDFNELSEERRTILLELHQAYYYPIILNCLVVIVWLQVFLDESLDLTNNTFIFVEKSKEKLSYVSNIYRPNPSGMIDNFIVGLSLMILAKTLGW